MSRNGGNYCVLLKYAKRKENIELVYMYSLKYVTTDYMFRKENIEQIILELDQKCLITWLVR